MHPKINNMFIATVLLSTLLAAKAEYFNEIKVLEGHTLKENYISPKPHEYVNAADLPDAFTWGNVNGLSYLTHSLNQHIPQYCGSCWAHGALSSFADRIKIARNAEGDDINLSIQFILNCGTEMAGSCHGGYHTGTYEFIQSVGYVPYDTCQSYMACSKESTDGICKYVDTTCKANNICRTCDTFAGMGGQCSEIAAFPNATIAEYGTTPNDVDAIKSEIFARGPVAATVNAEPIVAYAGGVYKDATESRSVNHIVSIVGWGMDEESGKQYWIVRNSWGQYWGEMGYFRIEMGDNLLGIESGIAWATPGAFTVNNFPCSEDGKNCRSTSPDGYQYYVDPSGDIDSIQRRLKESKA